MAVSRQVKINSPQPGETKSQFMTRSVRLLMKSGKSKASAISISARVWDNMSQTVQITPNETDANVTFSLTQQGSQRRQAPQNSRSVVQQMNPFSDLTKKLDNYQASNQAGQQDFLKNLQSTLISSIMPLASAQKDILRDQQHRNPGQVNQFQNNQNIPRFDPDNLTNLLQDSFKQQIKIQQDTLSGLTQLIQISSKSYEELSTMRSTGMNIRRAKKTSSPPLSRDFWTKTTANPQLMFGKFNLDQFVSQIADESPMISKGTELLRSIIHPIQTIRRSVGDTVRKGIGKIRDLGQDVNSYYQDNPDALKKDAGIRTITDDQLSFKTTTKSIPEKLGELADYDKEKIDILRNIYSVNRDSLSVLSRGKVSHQYTQTIDKEKTYYDTDTGDYLGERDFRNRRQSNIKRQQSYLDRQRKDRARDPILSMMDKLIGASDQVSKSLFGFTDRLSNDELKQMVSDRELNDPFLVDFLREKQLTRGSNVIAENEMYGARQFGPHQLARQSFGQVTGLSGRRLNDEMSPEELAKLGEDAYMRRPDGSYILNKQGEKQYRHAKHDPVTGELDLSKNAKFSNYDLEYSKVKEATSNPFTIVRDIADELKNTFHPLTKMIRENVDENSNFMLKALKFISPNIEAPDQDHQKKQAPGYEAFTRTLNRDVKSTIEKSWLDNMSKAPKSFGAVNIPGPIDIGNLPEYTLVTNDAKHLVHVFVSNAEDLCCGDKKTRPDERPIIIEHSDDRKLEPIIVYDPHTTNKPEVEERRVSNTSVTDVGKELEAEKAKREQQRRDTVQQQIADYLKQMAENNSEQRPETKPEEEKKGGLFSWLLKGLGALGGLLFGSGGLAAIGSGLAVGLAKAGGIFGKFLKFGLMLEGLLLTIKGASALWEKFGGTDRKPGQSVEDWQNENATTNLGMSAAHHAITGAGHLAAAKFGKNITPGVKFGDAVNTAKEGIQATKVATTGSKTALTLGEHIGAVKTGLGTVLKSGAKGLGHSLLKKIPVLGAVVGMYSGMQRWGAGDYLGATLEFGSGIASIFPGIGTAISLGLDGLLFIRDLTASSGSKSETGEGTAVKKEDSKLTKGYNKIKTIFKSVWDIITFNDFFGGIKNLARNTIALPISGLSVILDFLGFDWLSDKVSNLSDFVAGTSDSKAKMDTPKDLKQESQTSTKKLFQGAYQVLSGNFSNGFGLLAEAAKELDIPVISSIMDFLSFNWVGDAVNTTTGFIKSSWDGITSAVGDAGNAIARGARNLFGGDPPQINPVTEIRQAINPETYHSGGQIKKLHDGGLPPVAGFSRSKPGKIENKTESSDQVPIIAQKDEYILTKHETQSILSLLKTISTKMDNKESLETLKKLPVILDQMYDEQLNVNRNFYSPLKEFVIKDLDNYDGIYSMFYRLINDPMLPNNYVTSSDMLNPADVGGGFLSSLGFGGGSSGGGGGGRQRQAAGGETGFFTNLWNQGKAALGFGPSPQAPGSQGGIAGGSQTSRSGPPTTREVLPSIGGKVTPRDATSSGYNNANAAGTENQDTRQLKLKTGEMRNLRDMVSGSLDERTQSKMGIGYSFGNANDRAGYDCSGWTRTSMVDIMQKINQASEEPVYDDKLINTMRQSGSSEGIIDTFAAKGFPVKQGKVFDFNHSDVKPGSIISFDTGKTSFDRGRAKGIDHVVMTYMGADGKMYVSESRGGKGIDSTEYSKYMARTKIKNGYMYVVDPLDLPKDQNQDDAPKDSSPGINNVAKIPEEVSKLTAEQAAAASPPPQSPGLNANTVEEEVKKVQQMGTEASNAKQPLDNIGTQVQKLQDDTRDMKNRNKVETTPVPTPPNKMPNITKEMPQFENGQLLSGSKGAANATNQEWGQKPVDTVTANIIDRLFANTIINFQQASNNYAIGTNPMSVAHN